MHKEDIYILPTKQYYKILATLLDNCSTTCKLMNFDTMKVSIVTKNSVNTLIDGMYKKQKSTSAIGRFIKQQLLTSFTLFENFEGSRVFYAKANDYHKGR